MHRRVEESEEGGEDVRVPRVHIMWEMLREMDSPVPLEEKEAAGARKKKKAWSRFVYYYCAF